MWVQSYRGTTRYRLETDGAGAPVSGGGSHRLQPVALDGRNGDEVTRTGGASPRLNQSSFSSCNRNYLFLNGSDASLRRSGLIAPLRSPDGQNFLH